MRAVLLIQAIGSDFDAISARFGGLGGIITEGNRQPLATDSGKEATAGNGDRNRPEMERP